MTSTDVSAREGPRDMSTRGNGDCAMHDSLCASHHGRPPGAREGSWALKAKDNAFNASITKRLSSMRLQTYRNELNAGVRARPAPVSPSLHAALDFVEREERKNNVATLKGRVAGPLPKCWIPVSYASAHTEKGKQERRILRAYAIGASPRDEKRLSESCLQVISRLLAQADEETLMSIDYLPMHLKEALLRTAAIEAPVGIDTLHALFVGSEDEMIEKADSGLDHYDGDEWESGIGRDSEKDQLITLDLRFATLASKELLGVLFGEIGKPRFAEVAVLDLSYCSGINLTALIVHLGKLPQLRQLAINGQESTLCTSPGSLTRLAAATPWLETLEMDGNVPMGFLERFAWSSLWQHLSKLIIRGFRTPSLESPARSTNDQPRAGSLTPSPKRASLISDEKAAEEARAAVRHVVKRAGRTRWLEIIV